MIRWHWCFWVLSFIFSILNRSLPKICLLWLLHVCSIRCLIHLLSLVRREIYSLQLFVLSLYVSHFSDLGNTHILLLFYCYVQLAASWGKTFFSMLNKFFTNIYWTSTFRDHPNLSTLSLYRAYGDLWGHHSWVILLGKLLFISSWVESSLVLVDMFRDPLTLLQLSHVGIYFYNCVNTFFS